MDRFNQKRRIRILIFGLIMMPIFLVYFNNRDTHAGEYDRLIGECTVGVFSGSITDDGRPILWKNRDIYDPNQRFIYFAPHLRNGATTFSYIGDVFQIDSTRVWMGTNSQGFAIMNSDSYNLRDTLLYGIDDGQIMNWALEVCSTLRDFELLLDSTNITGRSFCWNFGVLDASGACAIYECANRSYVKFNPDDPDNSSSGYLIRANYSVSGDSSIHVGLDRFTRASELVANRLEQGRLDVGFVLSGLSRDLGNYLDDPYPLPYHRTQLGGPPGYIYNAGCTIANTTTSSAVAIRGIKAGEDPELATTFAILGYPVLSVAFPLWVKSGAVPICLSQAGLAPVYSYCQQRRPNLFDDPQMTYLLNSQYLLDDSGKGVYSYTLPLETWGIGRASSLLAQWNTLPPSSEQVADAQSGIASTIFAGFQNENADTGNAALPENVQLYNYPNPFNQGTHIFYDGPISPNGFSVKIYDLLGRLIQVITGTNDISRDVNWMGTDMFGKRVASGIYFYTLRSGPYMYSNKMTLLK